MKTEKKLINTIDRELSVILAHLKGASMPRASDYQLAVRLEKILKEIKKERT